MAFDPGLQSMRAAGIPVTRQGYANGQAGIRQSLDAMAQKMREGKIDAGVRSWAMDCLKAKGLDGRDQNTTPAKQASAILDCLRAATVYTPDPYGTESIQAAGATLCLRPNLCVQGGDCDDLTVALGSMYLSIGLPTQIVKQNFGADAQEHVLIAVYTGEDWQYADPSTKMPFGSAANAVSEVWVDPMEPIGNLPEASAELVTLGKVGAVRRVRNRSTTPHWGAGFGATGVVTPGDVLSYRNLWDSYVMDTARAAAACSASWAAAANGTGPVPNASEFAAPPDQKTLQLWANANQNISDSITSSWNQHAGLQDWEIVASAGDILVDFQKVVTDVGNFYQPQIQRDCPTLALPDPPGLGLQQQVVGQVEGLGILAHGVLQLFTKGAGGALEAYQTLGQKLTNPSTIEIGGVGLILGIVGTIVGLYTLDRLLPRR
jgi:hypothetical protein